VKLAYLRDMKRGVLALALAATLAGCTNQRDKAPTPAGGHAESPGKGAGATPRELAAIRASDASVTATVATVSPDAALAVKGGKLPGPSAQQQLDDQAVRMLAALGSSGSSRGDILDKVLSQPDLDLSAVTSDRFASSTGNGSSGGGVNMGGSGGRVRAGVGRVGGPGLAGGPGSTAPTGPRAVVTVESVTVVAGDIPSPLAGVMSRFSGVRACYQRQLNQDPTLAGTLRANLVLGDSGMVRSASVEPDGLDDPQLVRCVSAVMQRMRFTDASTDAALELAVQLRPEP